MIKNIFKKENKSLNAEELSIVYNLPLDLVKKILSQRKVIYHLWGEEEVPYNNDEYHLILLGAMITNQNQELIGVALPKNDPRSIDINKFLDEIGCVIQFHPHHGMVIENIS